MYAAHLAQMCHIHQMEGGGFNTDNPFTSLLYITPVSINYQD